MSNQLPIRARIYDVKDGETFTDPTSFVFNVLHAFTYHLFPALYCLTTLVAAHFPTFLFGVLCDANGSMRSNKLSPLQADFIKLTRTGGQDR
jgi:hypothetical protein